MMRCTSKTPFLFRVIPRFKKLRMWQRPCDAFGERNSTDHCQPLSPLVLWKWYKHKSHYTSMGEPPILSFLFRIQLSYPSPKARDLKYKWGFRNEDKFKALHPTFKDKGHDLSALTPVSITKLKERKLTQRQPFSGKSWTLTRTCPIPNPWKVMAEEAIHWWPKGLWYWRGS